MNASEILLVWPLGAHVRIFFFGHWELTLRDGNGLEKRLMGPTGGKKTGCASKVYIVAQEMETERKEWWHPAMCYRAGYKIGGLDGAEN